jgi:hypothetical protein
MNPTLALESSLPTTETALVVLGLAIVVTVFWVLAFFR